MQEETLYHRWQALARFGRVVYSAGHALRVIRAGRLNTRRGPDFIAARFELDGVVYQGDVECHLRTQDWYNHQHHLDRAFSQVLLHVVAAGASVRPVEHGLSGQRIPTVSLPEVASAGSCPFGHFPPEKYRLLHRLARQRLQGKARYFSEQLGRLRPEQVFQEAFFRAMGYPHNAASFQQLAGRVALASGLVRALEPWQLYALYAGQAGFLAAPADDYSARLNAYYQRRQSWLPQAALPSDVWQCNGQRSGNHPHFRLAGAVAFWAHLGREPWPSVYGLLAQRLPYEQLFKELRHILTLACDVYWQSHYALGRPLKHSRHRSYFGAARITEIVLNVFLPLSLALAQQRGSVGFCAYLEGVYLALPVQLIYEPLLKQFPWAAEAARSWPAQALNQALLELQEGYCLQKAVVPCPLFGSSCPAIDTQSKNSYTLSSVNNKRRLS